MGCSEDFLSVVPTEEEIARSLDALLELKNELGLRVGILEPYPHCFLARSLRFAEFLGMRCTAGVLSLAIGADGLVRPCPHMNRTYGNVLEIGLGRIWRRMEEWRDGAFLPKECLDCEAVAACGGGCRVNALLDRGKLNDMDPLASPARSGHVRLLLRARARAATSRSGALPPLMSYAPSSMFRREAFGGIVGLGPRNVVFLKRGSYLAALQLARQRAFSLSDAVGLFGMPQKEATAFLTTLLDRGIIRAEERG